MSSLSNAFALSASIRGEITTTLESYNLDHTNKLCVVCYQATHFPSHAPYCGESCSRFASDICRNLAYMVSRANGIRDIPDKALIVGYQNETAKRVLNIMLLTVLRCNHGKTRSILRELLMLLAEKSKEIPPSLELRSQDIHYPPDTQRFDGVKGVNRAFCNRIPVAVKWIRSSQGMHNERELKELFQYEALIWKTLDHERLVRLKGIFQEENPRCSNMVADWQDGGCALDFFKSKLINGTSSGWETTHQTFVFKWLNQIISGLKYLHDEGVAHGDLHSGNVLVVDPSGAAVRLTDFGLAVLYDAYSRAQGSNRGGRDAFKAPEQHDPSLASGEQRGGHSTTGRPTQRADVFAFSALWIEVGKGGSTYDQTALNIIVL